MHRLFFRMMLFAMLSIKILCGQSSVYFDAEGRQNVAQRFRFAISLFEDSEFVGVDKVLRPLRKYLQTALLLEKCDYYLVMSSYELRSVDAEKVMERFVAKYRNSYYCQKVMMALARWNFLYKDYKACVAWYKALEPSHIDKEDFDEYYFKYGYALVQTGDSKAAKSLFYQGLKSDQYLDDTKFYYGDLLYREENYHSAIPFFEELQSSPKYAESAGYYLSKILFQIGNYQEAATQAKALLDENPYHKNTTELEGIIGTSNFNVGNYDAAVTFLEKFMEKTLNPTSEHFYRLGYAYYKSEDYKKAIVRLNKIVNEKSALGQNALFHLGNSYMVEGKKHAAINAFESSSKMDFNPELKKEAWYNYAKLSYEIGNSYKSVPKILNEYIRLYPDTKRTQEIFDYLLNSYVTSRDFKVALNILERADRTTFQLKLAYQKVAYLYGLSLFNQERYEPAEVALKKSIKGGLDPKIRAKALFWLAEIRYKDGRYDAALETLKVYQVSSTSDDQDRRHKMYYHLGYCYFKMEKYDNAISEFAAFMAKNPQDQARIWDARLRIADSYFAKQEFETALTYYEKVNESEGLHGDYVTYQYAVCLGIMGKSSEQQTEFKNFIRRYKESPYMEEALFGLANSFFWQGNYAQADMYYNQLMATFSQSRFAISIQIKKGLMLYNQDKPQEAIQKFKDIVKSYPRSPEAKEAVANVRKICVDINRIQDYVNWVETVSFMDVTKNSLDSITYMVSEKLFFQNETTKAREGFDGYLKKYPHGIFQMHANFYLGEVFYAREHYTQAIQHYRIITGAPQNEFSERALVVLSKIYTTRENVTALVPVLEQLEKNASFKQNIRQARVGLMKSYSRIKNCEKALHYAQKVKDQEERFFVKQQACLIIARCALQLSDTAKAKKEYADIEVSGRGASVVEALYYKSFFLNREGAYERSNAVVSEIGASYAGYKDWGGKSLVIMADNYWKMRDPYQAYYILENVIENFVAYPEVVHMAKKLFTKFERYKQKNRQLNPIQSKIKPAKADTSKVQDDTLNLRVMPKDALKKSPDTLQKDIKVLDTLQSAF